MVGPFTFSELAGALVAVLLVAFAYLYSDTESRMNNTAFAALTSIICTLLISMRFELLPNLEENLRLERLADVSSETRQLFQILSEPAGAEMHPLMKYVLDVRMNSLSEYFDRATQGRFVVDPADLPEFLLDMLRSAKSNILATSYAQPESWWYQPWGKQYELENEAAARRKVKVIRTFLFANRAELEIIKPLLQKELANGISVKYALVSNLQPDLVSGLVIIDDSLAGELHLTPEKHIKDAEFFTRESDIEGIKQKIHKVDAQSRALTSRGVQEADSEQ